MVDFTLVKPAKPAKKEGKIDFAPIDFAPVSTGLSPSSSELTYKGMYEGEELAKRTRGTAEAAITGAEIVGGFTPASPIVMAGGEAVRSLIKGEGLGRAIKTGLTAGAIDAALTYAGGKIVEYLHGKGAGQRLAGKMGGKKVADAVSLSSGLPSTHISSAWANPEKYLAKPLSQKEELIVLSGIQDDVVKNLKDVFKFKVKTLEDQVAKESEKYITGAQTGLQLGSTQIKTAVSKFINDMIDRGVISKGSGHFPPAWKSGVDRLFARIDRYAFKGYNDATGKFGNVLKFEAAHKLKQDLYKIVGESYGKGDFTDVLAEAYKVAAKRINSGLRKLSPEYSKVNDGLKAIYDLYDEIGTKGLESFTGMGAANRFRAMLNDPRGRLILTRLESLLPKEKQGFMAAIEGLENVQNIRKSFQEPKTGFQNLPFISGGTASTATYLATKNLPLSALAGLATGSVSSPRMLRKTILASKGLKRAGREVAKKVAPLARIGTARSAAEVAIDRLLGESKGEE